jgi:hypothetical protein
MGLDLHSDELNQLGSQLWIMVGFMVGFGALYVAVIWWLPKLLFRILLPFAIIPILYGAYFYFKYWCHC